ncbi:hypothetical protein GCK32_005665 [Trichostrongylus colubriformis]|uniref:Uncharacterized protein n=1 Tax=Trichostrongylus colubriformis TaxID=6319 RepID=A0AAN8ILL6_TRICO
MQPIATPHDNSLTWLIEYSGGNLTSSFKVEDIIDKPLTTTDTIEISEAKEKALQLDMSAIVLRQQRQVSGFAKLAEAKNETSTTTESPKTTEKAPEKTTKEPTPTTPEAPTHINLTVTVGYLQFQTGQAPTYVNKNTQAVVFAVIEGILLGVILLVFLFRCYKRSKLRAAGLYPPRNINQPNSGRNTVYYDNGGTLSYPNPNSRPEIPSYRSPDAQPPLRLDSLSPRPQQPVITPQLMPVTTTQPRPAAATVTPAPLNYWPDQPQAQPVKNIMDSDF